MTTKDFQNRSLLRIFFSYFKPHKKLFILDMSCALCIALIDLAFPLVSRTALYTWLPEKCQCTLTPVHKLAANWRHLEGKRSLNTKAHLKNNMT